MILLFANGNSIEVSDISTITAINIEAKTLTTLEAMLSNFTEENMKHVTLGDQEYKIVIPESYTINTRFGDEKVSAYVVCRFKTSAEIMSEQITELQEAVAELAGE